MQMQEMPPAGSGFKAVFKIAHGMAGGVGWAAV